ncbi:hypothetical protein NBRC116187_10870 [Halopseudomonas sabulinigri]|uniref:Uncharacterized protein n=1 Tax=Halopseudomonas sabulinigri TaxID=472181 RepID=A0ABP9ZMQ5_9GAMM
MINIVAVQYRLEDQPIGVGVSFELVPRQLAHEVTPEYVTENEGPTRVIMCNACDPDSPWLA